MGRDRPRSFHAGMVGCAATQRINRETRACGSAECNARERVVDRKGETRFQNETYSEGGINALSGISGRICLRCRTSHWRRVWRETNPGDAPCLHWSEAAIARETSNRPDLRASVANVRRLDLEYSKIEGRFRPDRVGTLHSRPR